MKVLVIQLRQMGDILLTTPVLRAIKQKNPSVMVHFLCHPMGRFVLEGNPDVDKIHYQKDGMVDQLNLLRVLRREKFDIILDYMNNPRSAIYVQALCLARSQRSCLSYAFSSRRSIAYRRVLDKPKEKMYIVREKLKLAEYAGLISSQIAVPVYPIQPFSGEDSKKVKLYLESHPDFANAHLRIILSPTHRREARRWKCASWAALADWLTDTWKAKVVWIYGPGEKEYIEQCVSFCQSKTEIAPPTSFREMAAFMSEVDLVVATSNGPSHVAVACTPVTLQLHGPTRAYSWCPQDEQHWAVQSSDIFEKNPKDLSAISVRTIQEKLEMMRNQVEKSAERRRSKF